MKHALRAASVVAVIAASGLFAGTAAASGPPLSYDDDIISQFDANKSLETVRHLAVDIGPRRSGLPEEDEGAEYLAGVLRQNGFQATVYQYPFAGTGPGGSRPAAKVTSSDTTLYNGPNWQLSVAANSKMTGNDAPATGQVIWVNSGLLASDFPASAAGKIVMMNQAVNTGTNRNTQVVNAVAAGAIGVIIVGTGQAPPTVTLTTAQPNVPVVGGGDMHGDELKNALCPADPPLLGGSNGTTTVCANQKTVTLSIKTNMNPVLTRAVVIGRRFAVGDPTGTKAPIVMVGAHIDSVLGAPGAHDDATGNGVSMEIARVVGKMPLDKEIVIGGFGGEEDGLQGSSAWTKQFLADIPAVLESPGVPAQPAVSRASERARVIGEWQMDMVGTPYEPARLWALTPDGKSNFVVDEAYKSAARFGFTGLQNCRLGQSDHQAFFDLGIPSALFIWLDYRFRPAPLTCLSPGQGLYSTEPEYHTPRDGMNNVSVPRMQTMLDLIGSSFAHNAMNKVDVKATNGSGQPISGAAVTGDCGDGLRNFGTTDATGYLEVRVPHVTCNFKVANGNATGLANNVDVFGDKALPVSLTSADGSAGGSVTPTLALTLGTPPATFAPFTPGVTRTYEAATTANVLSTAGDATLSVADPSSFQTGHLVNGTFFLPQPLQARARNAANTGTAYNNVGSSASPLNLLTYSGPVSNDQVALQFSQLINQNDALRTGAYSKTLTFTVSTTTP
jgi:hypothetical protein